jgi:hypothetical protein
MKLNKLVVIVSLKNNDCYQVNLNQQEQNLVSNLIQQLHLGTIKISLPKLTGIKLEMPKKELTNDR